MRNILVVLLSVFMVFSLASSAVAKKPVKPPRGNSVESVLSIHNRLCLAVSEYTDCNQLQATMIDYGANGYLGYSYPAQGRVEYNSYYEGRVSQSQWETTVAHEVGGHVDTWNELVTKVGVSQAWTDYYDIDGFAQQWLAGKGYSFSARLSKELWLDCAGPVSHGYTGNYLTYYGVPTTVCTDHRDVLAKSMN